MPGSAAHVRFHRDDGTEQEDTITDWQGMRRLQPGSIQRSSYEYHAVTVNTRQDQNPADQGAYGERLAQTLEDYHSDTHHAARDDDDYLRYGKLRMRIRLRPSALPAAAATGNWRSAAISH